jgi:energy-coupling factor transporter transmembrane protein EcfT
MQDPRLRLAATVILSAAAFGSMSGAVAVLFWWLLFTPRLSALPGVKVLLPIFGTITVTALVSEWAGGDGISYLIRMVAILLIAAWAYADRQEGDMLAVAVWAFGKKIGFEIGLIAEMGVTGLSVLRQDIDQMQMAMRLKGMEIGIRTIIPIAANLIVTQIRRADEQARLLTVRGYTSGGNICPVFRTDRRDVLVLILAVIFAFFSYIPVRDVFIVVQ